MIIMEGAWPVHCSTVAVMTGGLRVAVVDLYSPFIERYRNVAERLPCSAAPACT